MIIKNYKMFLESLNKKEEFNYLAFEELPNGIRISLTEEGKERVSETVDVDDKDEIEKMTYQQKIQLFDELFDDIKGNSDYAYHTDLGESGLAMTSAEGITKGYYINDDGEYEEGEESELYYYNHSAIKCFVDDLLIKGYVDFNKA